MKLAHKGLPVVAMLLFGLVCGNVVLAETIAPQKQTVELDMKKVERNVRPISLLTRRNA